MIRKDVGDLGPAEKKTSSLQVELRQSDGVKWQSVSLHTPHHATIEKAATILSRLDDKDYNKRIIGGDFNDVFYRGARRGRTWGRLGGHGICACSKLL